MKKAVIILSLIFPLLGSGTKKPIDVSIALSPIIVSDTEIFYHTFLNNWCVFYQNSETGKYHLDEAIFYFGISSNDCTEEKEPYIYIGTGPNLFLIKGLNPQNKPLKTLVLPLESVKVDEKHSFRFGRKTYTLRAEGDERTDGYHGDYWYKVKDYKLYLSDGRSEQLMTTVDYFDGTSPDILWIGDLDGDGKPDFVMRTATWYEGDKIELYLSSIAEKGELIKLAGIAEFNYSC